MKYCARGYMATSNLTIYIIHVYCEYICVLYGLTISAWQLHVNRLLNQIIIILIYPSIKRVQITLTLI